MNMTRKDFLKTAGACALGAVGTAAGASAPAAGTETGRAKVYFSPVIDSDHLNKLYDLIKDNLSGKIAIKLHTGERHGPNILPREMVKSLQARIPESTIVETNTLYHGDRYTTEDHLKTLEINGWTFCPVDIMDAEGTVNLPVKGGKHFKEVSMGGHIVNYDSMLVLTHFKGHAMGGFGGSMKNIAIGCADGRIGKQQVHAVSDVNPPKPSVITLERRLSLSMCCAACRLTATARARLLRNPRSPISAFSLPQIFSPLIRLRSIWSTAVLPQRSMTSLSASKAAVACISSLP